MHSVTWDDLRYVLAVAETGSLSAAARALGVNHATVLRHVQSFEEAHGGPVFSRTPHGYAVLPERTRVIEAARDASAAVDSAARLMRGAQAPMRGTVRLSATDTLCTTLLPGIAARIMAGAEGLRIEIRNTNAHEDFSRMQADVAIRPGKALSDDMTGQIAAHLGFGHYRASAATDKWLGMTGHLSRAAPAEWIAAHIPADRIVASADSFVTLRDLAATGAGQAILPCLLGDAHPALQRVEGVFPEMAVPLWVASHADLARSPRIRLVTSRLLKHLGDNAAALAGTA